MNDPNEKKQPETYDETDTMEIDPGNFDLQIDKYKRLLDDARKNEADDESEKTDSPDEEG